MKTISAALLLMVVLTNCRPYMNPFTTSALQSATTIPPGKTFELGGDNNGAFSAQVRNVGNVVVAVSQRQADGQVTALGQLRPGAQQVLKFAAGSAALFANASPQDANLGLKVVGDTSLKMEYTQKNN